VKAHADTVSPETGTSTVTFTAPENGGITLSQVPDIDYGSHDLSVSPIQSFAGQFVKNSKSDARIAVTNLSGSDKKYAVTLSASDLSSSGASVQVSSLTFAAKEGTHSQLGGFLSGLTTPINVFAQNGGNAQTILNSSATGDTSGTLTSGSLSSDLTIGTNNLKPGAYSGTLTYTLQPQV